MTAYSPHKPLPIAHVPQWDFETDIAIIGFGATGASAAIEARKAGADVMLFERSSGSGGASALSGGEIYIGGGTDAQLAAGFADTVEDFTTYLKLASGPCVDEAKCELYGREALSHYQWLKDQGVPYRGNFLPGKVIEPTDDSTLIWSGSEAAAPFYKHAKPAPRGHVIQHMGWGGGRPLVDILEARARDLGTEIHVDARAVALITDGDRIAGAVVRIDNQDRFVRAHKGVVLATGGFVFNEAMRRKYCPESFRVNSPIGDKDDGIGIELGASVGGDPIHMDQFFTTCPWTIPEDQAYGVFVNVAGQRFINEDCYHGRVSRCAVDQPGGKVYLLLDSAHFTQPLDLAGITIAGTGETWEEVEAELEMPAGTLSATMHFYNTHAREGHDPLFDKQVPILKPLDQSPFVALECNFETSYFSFFTLGGLKTSADAEVLDRGGSPIPGLYAAGRCTSGLPAWGHGYSSGLSLADCTFFGRQAGRRAAA
ncbi:MAG: flavoprotein [Novosphingobium sp. 28-62-57]|uniref:FAD-dependent oxidoreductase n=1 Tax=unclassified Novosphingobium TaxID=2644732 RepID=UPI000BC698A2|nr:MULTISPECIES: FAD-dependent oxidoreductase [unclassified Novosphingobium]OYW51449.1 MAG: flavoprotein [Novosphingobium sp. 12-62-10]OYZ45035.1 MAG: flavoprotein [Novosphingobium sp. 16-62-11]OZA40705.1 MAG: flavoprotein [Novosphingobium sp. 17-62-9]OYZ10416.1 MAG: flavoprotein [Novosphingobium sp. 28-62-57]HQS68183.1 FAD-dependent oxidoreductase [Novosphingobium sp.]